MSEERPSRAGATPVVSRIGHAMNWLRSPLRVCEDALHLGAALVLLTLGALVLYHTADDLLKPGGTFSLRVINSVNGVLFVIIVLELMQTVLAHFDRSGFQLKPFLIIGIISAVRHMLTIGARLTLAGDVAGDVANRSQTELGVETGVVLGLTVGLLLVRLGERSDGGDGDGD